MTYFKWRYWDGTFDIGNENFIAIRSSDGEWTDVGKATKYGQVCQGITVGNKGTYDIFEVAVGYILTGTQERSRFPHCI